MCAINIGTGGGDFSMVLYLIRHGMTDALRHHIYYGRTDVPLEEGEAERLRSLSGRYPRAELFYTSGMKRTEDTLAAIYGDVDHRIDRELREIDFGIFEMTSYEQIKDLPEYQEYITGDFENKVPPGGESFVHMRDRSLRAVGRILAEGRDSVLVIHGGNIAMMMGSWFPYANSVYDFIPEAGNGYKVVFSEGKAVSYEKLIEIL